MEVCMLFLYILIRWHVPSISSYNPSSQTHVFPLKCLYNPVVQVTHAYEPSPVQVAHVKKQAIIIKIIITRANSGDWISLIVSINTIAI